MITADTKATGVRTKPQFRRKQIQNRVLKAGFFTLLAAALTLALGALRFNRKVDGEVRSLLVSAEPGPGPLVTEEMLEPLPAPVQRYLRYAGIVGRPMVSTVRLEQTGRIREDSTQPWMNYEAEQHYSVSPPAFVWRARVPVAGLPLVRIRDRYTDGSGQMWVTLGGLYTMVDAHGAEMDHANLMRHLNEMMWFPSALLGENVSWEAVDDHSAQVTLTDHGLSATATMYFDDEGRLTDFRASRYRTGSGMEEWSTPITEYGYFQGLWLPRRGQGVWHLRSGDLVYVELEIAQIEYE